MDGEAAGAMWAWPWGALCFRVGVQMGAELGGEGGAQRWEGRKGRGRGRGETAVGPAGGAGVFWESGGLCWGFLEDTAGAGLLGLAWELGERGRGARCLCVCLCAHSCVITCVCHCVCIAGSPLSCLPDGRLPSEGPVLSR